MTVADSDSRIYLQTKKAPDILSAAYISVKYFSIRETTSPDPLPRLKLLLVQEHTE